MVGSNISPSKGNSGAGKTMPRDLSSIARIFCRIARIWAANVCSVPLRMSKSSLSTYKCGGKKANLKGFDTTQGNRNTKVFFLIKMWFYSTYPTRSHARFIFIFLKLTCFYNTAEIHTLDTTQHHFSSRVTLAIVNHNPSEPPCQLSLEKLNRKKILNAGLLDWIVSDIIYFGNITEINPTTFGNIISTLGKHKKPCLSAGRQSYYYFFSALSKMKT